MSVIINPFHLLEINIISAQDIARVSRSMRTYAVAWVNPERKLTSRIDQEGDTNPTWNDKFVFRVDNEFLNSDTSAVMIQIHTLSWLRDICIGSVRVLINNLIPPSTRSQANSSMRFIALQIRRPSGRPQGILNMGVTLLDSTMRSMPLYTQLSTSAVGYHDLMSKQNLNSDEQEKQQQQQQEHKITKNQLRRSQSERTDLTNDNFMAKPGSIYNGSICNGSICNGSIVNGSEIGVPHPKPAVANGSVYSDVGPSPSVVAAAVAKEYFPADDAGSSILGDWTAEESVEGLKTKLERWRTELPPIYDRDYQKYQPEPRHSRRHTDGGGLFSCFGNAYGCEFTIVCGANSKKKRHANGKVHLSPSDDNLRRSYLNI